MFIYLRIYATFFISYISWFKYLSFKELISVRFFNWCDIRHKKVECVTNGVRSSAQKDVSIFVKLYDKLVI